MRFPVSALLILACCLQCRAETPKNLRDDQLVAWCIVPFDSKERGPAERAEMVQRLGLRRVAYDWRAKHVPTFEDEILEYKKRGIEYFAFWGAHEQAFTLFEKHGIRPQVWQTLGSPTAGSTNDRIKEAAEQMLPLVERTRTLGSKLGLYNHGGWGGEPENMVAVCKYLHEHHQAEHVGLVYNLHHGHGHIDDFASVLKVMQPYLLCLNLNGMTREGDQQGKKILPLGEGEFDVRMLTVLRDSGYDGPVGIIGHTQDDVELRLRDNLDGLHWILPQLDGKPAGEKPKLRTYSPEESTRGKKFGGILLDGGDDFRNPPLTVECDVILSDATDYNILVASDTKRSGEHWEIFTMPGSGFLTAYVPGRSPDHVRSDVNVCDGNPHRIAMRYDPTRIRLMVDGTIVADRKVRSRDRKAVPGGLGIGRLVEGGLGCRGSIRRVRISRGDESQAEDDRNVLLDWQSDDGNTRDALEERTGFRTPEYSEHVVADLVDRAKQDGDLLRGLMAFAGANSACVSCHKIGANGGGVGPDLSQIGKTRKPDEIVASVLWPSRDVKAEYIAQLVVDASGKTYQGYVVSEDEGHLTLKDPSRAEAKQHRIAVEEIEFRREVGSLMPDNLAGTLSEPELVDLVRFLCSLGTHDTLDADVIDSVLSHAQSHAHAPAEFPHERKPLRPDRSPHWEHHVNRDRVFDFYAKQADYFRKQTDRPPLLAEYPGLDGGALGHWGNQDDTVWADGRWNDTDLGTLVCNVFRSGKAIPRSVCVRLGNDGDVSACFDPDTLTYPHVWRGGFVKFSDHRHGFLGGVVIDGKPLAQPKSAASDERFHYHGFYRLGRRVVFSYRIGDQDFLDAPDANDGRFVRVVAPADEHPLADQIRNPSPQWPLEFTTEIAIGKIGPYAIDSIGLPFDNPWNALMFCSAHAFLPDGSALVCTMQGDVWRVRDFAYPSTKAIWRRFASGLHHPLGIVADEDGIFVLGRDQITRLHDLNGDGEADYYECFSKAFETSPAGHDFICGLERDDEGNFYIASGNQGLVKISAEGDTAEVIATGFRNPDGLGISPDGIVTVPCSEGSWTPASMICAVRLEQDDRNDKSLSPNEKTLPHFGHQGPRNDQPPSLPMVYLPRGVDNSSGGQVYVSSDKWGPLGGRMVHLSFGTGKAFLLLRDEVNGQLQGAVVPFPGDFRSGVHRGTFHPNDGQLYVTGMQGWGSYTPDDGCFERVRYTGEPTQQPIGFHVHRNGIVITFSDPLDPAVVENAESHFAQVWNYRYSSAYGSPEFSTRHRGVRGHDVLRIRSAHLLDGDKGLFLELPDLQAVNQLHLRLQSSEGEFHDLFATVHAMDTPFAGFPSYVAVEKVIAPHPMVADLAMVARSIPNPYRKKIKRAREIEIETGTNLSFKTRLIRTSPGEPIKLTLVNPDVVPHNWALVKPGTLERVGRLADRLISDPDAAFMHYVPTTSDVLASTDVVLPRDSFSIYFRAPEQPGRYPFLCTFPGHWKVMNGVLLVDP